MTSMLSNSAPRAFSPEDIFNLVVRPAMGESVAAQTGTVLHGSGASFRVPVVAADPSAAWTDEGATITESVATLAEVAKTYKKLAGLTIVSNELANDSDPAAATIIGNGLARDLARKLDVAFFGTKGASTLQPAGLEDLVGFNAVTAGAAWANVDPFTEAIYAAESEGRTLTAFVANPADALLLAQLKEGTTSSRPLLEPDPTQPTRRMLGGVALFVSPAVTVGTVWGLPGDVSMVALRQGATLDVDGSQYFSSDRTAIRAILRAEFAWPHPKAIQKVTLTS